MVYQRMASPAQSSSRRGSRERCLGCGYGLGQFQVEYASNDDDGLGRGYCSLDCYTSAKVTGRAMQHQSRARGGGSDGQHWGGRGMHRYRHEPPQPQPLSWPTGLLLDAPPEPKPWRRTAIMSQRQQRDLGWISAVLPGSSTGTFGAGAAGDDTSSQESSVADWQTVDSEDGETSVGSGSGVGGVGAARGGGGGAAAVAAASFNNNHHLVGRRPDSFAARETGGSGGGAAAAACGGSGGSNAPGVTDKQHDPDDPGCAAAATGIGGGSLLAPSRQHSSRTDGRSAGGGQETTGGAVCPRERLPPLAPIPRVGAFPAQHRVHGTEGLLRGSGGDRKAEVRAAATTMTIVRPHAQAFPPSHLSTVEEGPMVPPPAAPPAARAEAKAGCVAADSTTAVVSERCRREQASNATPADAVGGASPSRPAGEGGSAVSNEGSTALQEDAAGGKDPVIASKEEITTPAAVIGGGTRCGAAAAAAAGAAGADSSSDILGCRGLAPCASATVVPTKVTVRQWRRLFLP
ncbi:unnamed protein product [Ectocarpus sp. 12 AP-2014]